MIEVKKANKVLVPPPFQKATFVSSMRDGNNIKLRKASRGASTATTASSSTSGGSASSILSNSIKRRTTGTTHTMGNSGTLRGTSRGGNNGSMKSRKVVSKGYPNSSTGNNPTTSDDVSTSASKIVDDIFRAKRRAYVRRKYREHVNNNGGGGNKEIMGKSKESFTNAVLKAAKKEPSIPNNDDIDALPLRRSQQILREQPNVNIIAFDNRSIGDESSVSMSRALQPHYYGSNFPIVVKCDVHANTPVVTSKHIFDTSDALLNSFQTVLNGVGDLAIGTIQTFKATEKKCDDCYDDCDGGSEFSKSTANTSVSSSRSSSFTSYYSGKDEEEHKDSEGFMSRGGNTTSTFDDLRCGFPGSTTVTSGTTKSFLLLPQITQGCCKAEDESSEFGKRHYEDYNSTTQRDDDATVTTWASSFLSRPLRVVKRNKESTNENSTNKVVTVDAAQFEQMTSELTTLRNDLQVVKNKLASGNNNNRSSSSITEKTTTTIGGGGILKLPHINSVGSASAILQIPSKSDNESIVEAAFSAVAKRPVQRIVGLRSSTSSNSNENDRKHSNKKGGSGSSFPRLAPPRHTETDRTCSTTKSSGSTKLAPAAKSSNKATDATRKVANRQGTPQSGTVVVKAARTRSTSSKPNRSISKAPSGTRSSGGASTSNNTKNNMTAKKVQVTRITASTRRAKHTQLIVDTSNKKRNKIISSTPIV